MLGGGDRVAAGGVHHDHAAFRGGLDIDVIHADAGAADDLEVGGGGDELCGDFCLAADDERGELGDDLEELVFLETGLHGYVQFPGAAELGDATVGYGIGYKNFRNFHIGWDFLGRLGIAQSGGGGKGGGRNYEL